MSPERSQEEDPKSLFKVRKTDFLAQRETANKLQGVLDTGLVTEIDLKGGNIIHKGDRVCIAGKETEVYLGEAEIERVVDVIRRNSELAEVSNANEQERIEKLVAQLLPYITAEMDGILTTKDGMESLIRGAITIPIDPATMGRNFTLDTIPVMGDQRYAKQDKPRKERNNWFAEKVAPVLGQKMEGYFMANVLPRWEGYVYIHGCTYHACACSGEEGFSSNVDGRYGAEPGDTRVVRKETIKPRVAATMTADNARFASDSEGFIPFDFQNDRGKGGAFLYKQGEVKVYSKRPLENYFKDQKGESNVHGFYNGDTDKFFSAIHQLEVNPKNVGRVMVFGLVSNGSAKCDRAELAGIKRKPAQDDPQAGAA